METPLANGEDRGHTHNIASKVTLVVKSVSAIGCCNPDGACYGDYPLDGGATNATSGLPFVQLLLCTYTGATNPGFLFSFLFLLFLSSPCNSSSPFLPEPVPYGTISFFDNSNAGYSKCSDVPGEWATIQSVVVSFYFIHLFIYSFVFLDLFSYFFSLTSRFLGPLHPPWIHHRPLHLHQCPSR